MSSDGFVCAGCDCLSQTLVSLDRVDRFLHLDDVASDVVVVDGKENDVHVVMEGLTAAWRKKEEEQETEEEKEKEKDAIGESEVNVEIEETNADADEGEVKEVVVLRDFNLTVKRGECVAIVGSVGCGKSSLLECILGEMICLSGTV